jgi:RNA polymerase sigma-70 factor (ECF subfamily)
MSRAQGPGAHKDRSDSELVEEAQKAPSGDLRAFDELVRRFQEPVKTNCRFLSGSDADAEDLAQEVFVKAFFGLPRFEGRASFGTWIKRIKANHCINFVKKQKRHSFVDLADPVTAANEATHVSPKAPDRLTARERQGRIKEALDQMSDTLRIPLVLRDMDGLSYDEVARELGIGLSATKMRIKRGRELFRTLFQDEEGGPEPGPATEREQDDGSKG